MNGAGTTRDCASMGKPAGPPNGAHLQLQIRDSELAQFPAWKQTILRAMRDYGMYDRSEAPQYYPPVEREKS